MAAGYEAKDLFQLVAAEGVGKLGLAFHSLPPGHVEVKSVGAGSWGEQHEVFSGDLLVEAQGKDLKLVSKEEFRDMISQQRPLTLIFYAREQAEPLEAGAQRRSIRSVHSAHPVAAEPQPQQPQPQTIQPSQAEPSHPSSSKDPGLVPKDEAQPQVEPEQPEQPEQPAPAAPEKPEPVIQTASMGDRESGPRVEETKEAASIPDKREKVEELELKTETSETQDDSRASATKAKDAKGSDNLSPVAPVEPVVEPAVEPAVEPIQPVEPMEPVRITDPPEDVASATKLTAAAESSIAPGPEEPNEPQATQKPAYQVPTVPTVPRVPSLPSVPPVRLEPPEDSAEPLIPLVPPEPAPAPAQPQDVREKKKSAELSTSAAAEKPEEKQEPFDNVDRPHSSGIQRVSVASTGSKAKKDSSGISGQAATQGEAVAPADQVAAFEAELRAARDEVLELREKLRKAESTSGRRSREADAAAASYARLKTELVAESAERVALREKNKTLSAVEQSEYEALQNLQHEVAAEADEVTALRQEVRDARQEAAASPKKARESQRAREDLLKSELEELEVTLKKVRADLRRSQEVVRERDAEMWRDAEGGGAAAASTMRMEEALARGLQRQLLDEQQQRAVKQKAAQDSEMQSVQTELRIEKAAMRSIQRATEAGTEETVEKHLRHQSDVKDSLQRAENAAVRGLKRRQDEVKRMTLELHDPLVEEANAIRKGVSDEEEMAQKLSTRLRNLEEGMAELQDDKGSARVVQKAEKFDAAEQSAAQALKEEVEALRRLDEMKKELEGSDLYSLNVELHKERDLHKKAVKGGAEWAAEARTFQVSNVKESTEVALLRQKLLSESSSFGRLQSILAAEEMTAAKANESLEQLRKDVSRGEAENLKNQLSLQMGKSSSQAQQVVILQEKLEEEVKEMDRLRHQELLRRHQFTLEAAEAAAHRAACQLAEDRLDSVPAAEMSERLRSAHEQLQEQLLGLQEELKELKRERLESEKREQNSLRDEASDRMQHLQHLQHLQQQPVLQSVTLDAVDLAGPGESSQTDSAAREAAIGSSDVVKPVTSAPAGRMFDTISGGINPQPSQPSPHFGFNPPKATQASQVPELRSEVAVLRASEAALRSEMAELATLQEQGKTNDEFQKMRRALEQDRERVKGSQEQVLLLQREIEAQKAEMDQVSATSKPTPRPKAKRVVQTRAMPPRSHATPSRSAPGRSRPPRSPPATTRLPGETVQPDAPEDEDYDDDDYDEILNSSSGVEGQVVSSALAAPFAELNDEIAELQRKNEVLETLVSERNAANAAAKETQRWRVPEGETSEEAMAAYEKRLRKERREAAAAAMRAVAAKQALEEELANKRAENLSQELMDATKELQTLQAQVGIFGSKQASDAATAIKDQAMSEAAALTSTLHESKERISALEEQVARLQQEAAEVPKMRSLLDAAEKRLLKDNQAEVELSKIRRTLHEENQMALTYAAQDAKDAEDMLRSALAAETTCLILSQSEVQRAEEKTRQLEDAGRRELEALRQGAREDAEEAKKSIGTEAEGARLLQEAEEALVSMADEKVEAAETRAELRQEKALRAAELRAANWFYFAEATAWAEGESAEASAVVASRQEETRVVQQQENSLNAATAEVAAFKAEAASMRKEALGLRGDLGKEEVAFQQMRVAVERARAAESATLRSALTEVRAEAAKGASAFHRAEDAERELRRLRLDRSEKEKQVQDLTRQLFDAERRASVETSQVALPDLQQIQRQLGILSASAGLQGPMHEQTPETHPTGRTGQGQGPIDGPMQGFRAGPVPGTHQTTEELGDRATQLRARAEGLRGEVQQWQSRRRQGEGA